MVQGTMASGIVTATSVSIGFGKAMGGSFGPGTPPAAVGTVESVGTDSSGVNFFTVKAKDGTTVTVDVTSSTTYKDPKVTSPSFADVSTGEMVMVQGTMASGVVTATSVSIGFGKAMGGSFGPGTPPAAFGTVESVGPGGQRGRHLHRERTGRHYRHRRRDFLYDLQGPEGHLAELRQRHHR